jgi:multisubunit Na+/H+ antiporter MnhC subunit
MIVYLACVLLLSIGIYCVAVKKNLIKMVIGIIIMEYAVNLFLVCLGYRTGGVDPILGANGPAARLMDPLPQAMALIAIILGLATTLLTVALALQIYKKYGTFDITKMRELKG